MCTCGWEWVWLSVGVNVYVWVGVGVAECGGECVFDGVQTEHIHKSVCLLTAFFILQFTDFQLELQFVMHCMNCGVVFVCGV